MANLAGLHLAGNDLTGPIPGVLGRLVNLEALDLGGNHLTGPIPGALGSLVNLERLSLGPNELSGPVPAGLGNLVHLQNLNLFSNALTGPIPGTLSSLVNLEWLSLRRNALTGPIPGALGRLVNLNSLSLGENALTGPIPDELGSLVNLHSLLLDENDLTGSIPSSLGSLANLTWLDLSSNALTGAIPGALGSLGNLNGLILSWNPLTGMLPDSLTRLSRLSRLYVHRTAACAPADPLFQEWLGTIEFRGATCNRAPQLVDTIPAQTLTESGPASVVSVDAYFSDPDGDPLTYATTSSSTGTVSTLVSGGTVWLVPGVAGTATVAVTARDAGGLSATQTLAVTVDASGGPQSEREVLEALYHATGGPGWTTNTNWKTSAPLGEWYGVTTDAAGRVTRLELGDNGLVGVIPPALGSLESLERLDLSSNELFGAIPSALGSPVNLSSLDLSENALTGAIPGTLGSLANLRRLDLSENALTGAIPSALGGLANLRRLDLSENALTGPIPASLGNLARLRYLGLGTTGLTGPIPNELGDLENLEWLVLFQAWGVSGPLPPGWRRLPGLSTLDVFMTQTCAPAAWREWLATIEFTGRLCETGTDVTIDVAVVYTPAAREVAGGAAAMAAVVDLMIAETNQAYEASGVHQRLALVERAEVQYTETTGDLDLARLARPSDGHMDGVHALRDRVGADLVHLIVGSGSCGLAFRPGAFAFTNIACAGSASRTFAHELGHNMGLHHDRYQVHTTKAACPRIRRTAT